MQNPYGNYFIQVILEKSTKKDREALSEVIISEAYYLSTQKFSSSVIIKFIEIAGKKELNKLFKKLLNPDKLADLIKSKHAKNVIFKCVSFMTPELAGSVLKNTPNTTKLTSLRNLLAQRAASKS